VAAVVWAAFAQAPVVGDINYYGLHKIAPERIESTLHLKAGERLPPSKGEMEDTLSELSGVLLARIEAVCCEGSRVTLFIGLEEKGAPHAAFRTAPAGDVTLPGDLVEAYGQFLAAVGRAASRGAAAESLAAGHSLMSDPDARAFQLRFAAFAEANLPLLRDVLRNGSEAEQRAVAVAVIDYFPKKPEIVADLQYALQDPDESVRANAARALNAVAVLASQQPELGMKIAPVWLVELLNSVVLSDRVEAVATLLTLTDRQNAQAIDLLRERSLPALAEMARWKTPRYALPPFLLLGRTAGIPDDELHTAWEKGNREAVIERALDAGKKRR
jgi:hypothetical protein